MKSSDHFLFHCPTPPVDSTLILDHQESHHALNVLRLQPDDSIQITDGKGTIYNCIVTRTDTMHLTASIVDSRSFRRTVAIHLLIALPDRDPFESAITECTALGVSRITPVIAEHCQKPWWKYSWEKHRERFMTKIMVSMKQSLFPFLPTLDDPLTLEKSLELCKSPVLLADQDGTPLTTLCLNQTRELSCFIGPPGGFSDNEIVLLSNNSAIKVKIGEPRFRTELAAVVICSQLFGMYLK
ncbi:MAG TPA: RsmE family RNA methyltransferase [Chitinispirillaceae bacterium]|nr:RsmE family RNA methyltransferase [Chitinispirillaceae bacterium]